MLLLHKNQQSGGLGMKGAEVRLWARLLTARFGALCSERQLSSPQSPQLLLPQSVAARRTNSQKGRLTPQNLKESETKAEDLACDGLWEEGSRPRDPPYLNSGATCNLIVETGLEVERGKVSWGLASVCS